MKNLSKNTLEELQMLLWGFKERIIDYKHVSEHLPTSLTDEINSFIKKLDAEIDRREDETE